MIPHTHMMGTDMIPQERLVAWGKSPCDDWNRHFWIKFINISLGDEAVMVLCRECGRTPLEALDALPVVIPKNRPVIPTGARETIANYLMDARVDGPLWRPPSTLTYQEAMRQYADGILKALADDE